MEENNQKSMDAEQPKEEMEQYDPWDIILFGRPKKPEVESEIQDQPKDIKKRKK